MPGLTELQVSDSLVFTRDSFAFRVFYARINLSGDIFSVLVQLVRLPLRASIEKPPLKRCVDWFKPSRVEIYLDLSSK